MEVNKDQKLNEAQTANIIKSDMTECCNSCNQLSKIYLLSPNDCVFENGVMVRVKRKYGKFKRVVHVFDCNNV